MASRAYWKRGAIVIWWDEAGADAAGDNPDDLTHTIGEIVISPLAHPNVNGHPFASPAHLTHSSDLRTMQEIFHVTSPLFLRRRCPRQRSFQLVRRRGHSTQR
jgi:phosphatidylinositol-3-phosphatase